MADIRLAQQPLVEGMRRPYTAAVRPPRRICRRRRAVRPATEPATAARHRLAQQHIPEQPSTEELAAPLAGDGGGRQPHLPGVEQGPSAVPRRPHSEHMPVPLVDEGMPPLLVDPRQEAAEPVARTGRHERAVGIDLPPMRLGSRSAPGFRSVTARFGHGRSPVPASFPPTGLRRRSSRPVPVRHLSRMSRIGLPPPGGTPASNGTGSPDPHRRPDASATAARSPSPVARCVPRFPSFQQRPSGSWRSRAVPPATGARSSPDGAAARPTNAPCPRPRIGKDEERAGGSSSAGGCRAIGETRHAGRRGPGSGRHSGSGNLPRSGSARLPPPRAAGTNGIVQPLHAAAAGAFAPDPRAFPIPRLA